MPLLPWPIILVLLIAGVNYLEDARGRIFGDLQTSVCRESAPDPRLGAVPVPPLLGAPPKVPPPPGGRPYAEPTVSRTAGREEARLALRYEPILKVATADRFWPVPVPAVLALKMGEERRTQFVGLEGGPHDADLSELRSAGDAREYIDYPPQIEHAQDEFCAVGHALDIPPAALARWSTRPSLLHPQRSSQFYFLDRHVPGGGRDLQYWFFYPYNYLPVFTNDLSFLRDPVKATFLAADFHEGDFEHVTVRLRPDPDGPPPGAGKKAPLRPVGVEMARHKGEDRVLAWDRSTGLRRSGSHPVVYAGFGGHASYEGCGIHIRQPKWYLFLIDWSICKESRVFTLGPRTPLVDLRTVSWGCWSGHFGEVPPDPAFELRVAGPKSPLYQAGNQNGKICKQRLKPIAPG